MSPTPRPLMLQRLAIGLMLTVLVACASKAPAPEPMPAPMPAPAPVAAPAPVVAAPADWSPAMQAVFDGLTSRLTPSGVVVEKTRDRQVLLVIPSDMSFGSGRSAVRPALADALQGVAQAMAAYPKATALVMGHTDAIGSEAINQRLSLQRADSVRDQLVGAGIDVQRISTQGMGSSAPLAENATVEGRARNRRVEILLME